MHPLPTFEPDADPAAIAHAVSSRGCAIVRNLAPPALLASIDRELVDHIDATPFGADDFSGPKTRRTGALLERAPATTDLIAHPTVLAVADAVIWAPKSTVQLHLTQAISLSPGAERQALHRDQWCFDFFPFPTDIQLELSTIWALDDFTVDNGATRVVPDSHTTPDDRTYDDDDAIPAVMPAGSVVLYTGRTVHGGGANTTGAVRRAINIDYAAGFLRQEENQYLSVSRAAAARLPEQVQRLMGYAYGALALGYVDDVRDPISVLDPHSNVTTSSFVPSR